MSHSTHPTSLKDLLRTFRKDILDNIGDIDMVLEVLYQSHVLSHMQYQEVKAEVILTKAVALLLDFVENEGTRGFLKFCSALEEEYPWLRNRLLEASKKFGLSSSTDQETFASDPLSSIPEYVLGLSPTEKQLLDISKSLSLTESEILAFELNLSRADIDRCRNASPNLILQTHNMLVMWKRMEGEKGTFKTLVNALCNCELGNKIFQPHFLKLLKHS